MYIYIYELCRFVNNVNNYLDKHIFVYLFMCRNMFLRRVAQNFIQGRTLHLTSKKCLTFSCDAKK